jgi:hypothetical protein
VPKVLGPLFSITAHGTFGGILTYQRRRSGAVVYPKSVPRITFTNPQVAQRASVASAVSSWRALDDASKAWWIFKAEGMAHSGYLLYIQSYLLGNL